MFNDVKMKPTRALQLKVDSGTSPILQQRQALHARSFTIYWSVYRTKYLQSTEKALENIFLANGTRDT
jgi:hypothetical protein